MSDTIKLIVGSNEDDPATGTTSDPIVVTEGDEVTFDDVKYLLDKDGNAIDADQKIIKTKDEVITHLTTIRDEEAAAATEGEVVVLAEGDVVTLDEVELTIDKEGNAIDKDNKIVKTAAELAEIQKVTPAVEGDTTPNYIEEFQAATNIKPLDDSGNPITYENTVEGISGYIQDTLKQGLNTGAQAFEEKLYETYPILKEVITHLKLNNTLDGFAKEADYSGVTISADDETQWEQIYIAERLAKGDTEQTAKDMAKYLKDDKKLKDTATASLAWLVNDKQTRDASNQALIDAKEAKDTIANNEYWASINTVLTSKKLKVRNEEITLPDTVTVKTPTGGTSVKTIADFKAYITTEKSFKIGEQNYIMTQHDYDNYVESQSRTADMDVYEAFMRFVGYDNTQLVKNIQNTTTTKNILKIVSKGNTNSNTITKGNLVVPVK